MSDTQLAVIIKARQMLEQAKTFDEIKQVMSISEQARLYAKRQGLGLESQNLAAEIHLDSTRKFGDALRKLNRATPQTANLSGKPVSNNGHGLDGIVSNNGHDTEYKIVLEETNTSRQDANRFEKIASIPEEKYKAIVAETKEAKKELTTAALLREVPHVSHNSGNNEWYTPTEYIAAAREVLGEIDLDPASSAIANKIIGAKKFYSIDDDGLSKKWRGRVWMNPPYASNLIGQFTAKLCVHVRAGDVPEAIVLVNNATEAEWFEDMASLASTVMFTYSRVKFLDCDLNPCGAPLQGQALLYFGKNYKGFINAFSELAWTVNHGKH